MMLPFRTEPEASAELSEAAVWYEERRDGLGIEFLQTIDSALDLIARFPQAGVVVPGVPLDLPVRRVPVRRFPFHVVYLVMPDAIRILAFAQLTIQRSTASGERARPPQTATAPRRLSVAAWCWAACRSGYSSSVTKNLCKGPKRLHHRGSIAKRFR